MTVLTAALVLITAYYAWQAHRTVVEMRDARRMSMLPKLVVDMRFEGVGFYPPALCNVGQGPALDTDVTISFEPDGDVSDLRGTTRRWRSPLVAPGERHTFLPPTETTGEALRMDRLTDRFRCVRLTGTCRTSFGETLRVDDEVGDLQGLWQLAKSSEELADEDSARKIVDELRRIRRALERSVPKPDVAEQRRRAAASKALFEEAKVREAEESQARTARIDGCTAAGRLPGEEEAADAPERAG